MCEEGISSYAFPYFRELAAGVSWYIFAGELQSGAFFFSERNGEKHR